MKVCAARKCQSWVCLQMIQLQCSMGCHGHHAILCNPKRFIVGDNKNCWYLVVPLNNFASMNNGCKVSRISPLSPSRGVYVGEGGIHEFTSTFSFINTHEFANDTILLHDYWMKGLVKLYH